MNKGGCFHVYHLRLILTRRFSINMRDQSLNREKKQQL